MLKLQRTCHRPTYQTLSNVFLKSMKFWKQIALVLWVLLHDDSAIEDLFYCVLAWSKTSLFFCQQFSALALSRLRITRSMISLEWLVRLMVR